MWQGVERRCSICAKPQETEDLEGTGRWSGSLAVLTDPRSTSATEEFVTWLRDNHRAVIAGGRTAGAGCGYVDGGHAIAL
jgi:C-terminal processing protease CtpA/Prc